MKLKEWRTRRNLTQKELGEACGVSRSLIMLIETHRLKSYPSIERRIARALHVLPEDVDWNE